MLAAVRPLPAEDVAVARRARPRAGRGRRRRSATSPPSPTARWTASPCAPGPAGRALRDRRRVARRARRPRCRVGDGEAVRISTGAALPDGRRRRAAGRARDRSTATGRRSTTTSRRGATCASRATTCARARSSCAPARAWAPPRSASPSSPAARRVAARAGPRVVVLATGDELVAPGGPLGPGQLHDSNALDARRARDAGRRARSLRTGAVRRHRRRPTRAAIAAALDGGRRRSSSPAASRSAPTTTSSPRWQALGVEEVFWRVALRPGRPTWFGTRGDTLVFGLPGNPVSAMVTFLLFARPALAALQGADRTRPSASSRAPRRGDPAPPRPRRVRARDAR